MLGAKVKIKILKKTLAVFVVPCFFLVNAGGVKAQACTGGNARLAQTATLSPRLFMGMPVLEKAFTKAEKSGFLPSGGQGELSLVQLLKEGQRIIQKGFIEENEITGSQTVFDSEDRSKVETALKKALSENGHAAQLEKILKIKTKNLSFGNYYSLDFSDDFLEEVKISPETIFDSWAWAKAAEFVKYVNENRVSIFGNSFRVLDTVFASIGVKSIKDKKRIKEYLEFKPVSEPPYVGLFYVRRKSLAAVVREAGRLKIAGHKWLNPEAYYGMTGVEKDDLEARFQEVFDTEFIKDKTKYPLTLKKNMRQLIQAADELGSIVGPNDRGVCLGRTPFYLFYARLAQEGIKGSLFNGSSGRYVQVSFSGGGWMDSGEEPPSREQVLAFRGYLKRLHLTPAEIVERADRYDHPGKTVIVDYLETGEGMEAFLDILLNWAKETFVPLDKLKQALVVYSLRKSTKRSALPPHLLGIPLKEFKSIDYYNSLYLCNANDSGFFDGIKDSYYNRDWANDDVNPMNDIITRKGYLICAHILRYLEKTAVKRKKEKAMLNHFPRKVLPGNLSKTDILNKNPAERAI